MRALLVCNPTASKVTPSQHHVVERALAATFELDVEHTESRGHAAELARDAAGTGAKAVIVYGGDGTVNEVVNGLVARTGATDVVLGILPGGGTNVLARTLGSPNELIEATDRLIGLAERACVRRLGLGHLQTDGPDGPTSRVFSFGAGLGLDAETVRRVEESGLRPRFGDWAFVYNGLRSYAAMRRAPAPPILVDTPDGPVPAWWAVVSKSDPLTYMGSRPFRLAPLASHERGLDVTAGTTAHLFRTLRWIGQAFRTGNEVRHPEVLYVPNQPDCSLRAPEPVPLQADGEYLGQVTSLRASVLPDALPVYA